MLAGILFFSCDNDDYPYSGIPSIVLNEFWAHFPTATDVEFIKAGEDYEVDFEMSGKDAGAVIAHSGILVKEKQEIPFEQLPAEIQNALLEYGKDKIEDPEIIKSKDKVFYQVKIKRFLMDEKVVLDKWGKTAPHDYWK